MKLTASGNAGVFGDGGGQPDKTLIARRLRCVIGQRPVAGLEGTAQFAGRGPRGDHGHRIDANQFISAGPGRFRCCKKGLVSGQQCQPPAVAAANELDLVIGGLVLG